jgi:hypothetical protein
MIRWKERLRAVAIHFTISSAIAAVAALLVFALWYPYPYREISGGRELFLLVVIVDVILGPLMTLAIFNRDKSRRMLVFDFSVIGLLQVLALAYGLWTMHLARPVHLVFEFNRFAVVHAIDVPEELLDRAPAGITALPVSGPTLLAVRPFRSAGEEMETTLAAIGGVDLSARPDLWQAYDQARPRVKQEAKPIATLKQRFPQQAGEIDAVLARAGRDAASTAYLPMKGRKTFWTVFIDSATADVVGFLPLDSF